MLVQIGAVLDPAGGGSIQTSLSHGVERRSSWVGRMLAQPRPSTRKEVLENGPFGGYAATAPCIRCYRCQRK